MHYPNSETHIASGQIMGGPWQLRHVPTPGIDPKFVADQAYSALQRVDDTMSTYKNDSELMLLNQAEVGVWHPVSRDIYTVLSLSRSIAIDTGGALDITLGGTVENWGFGVNLPPRQKPPMETSQPRGILGFARFALDADIPAVKKYHNFYFDLNAVAKGYAVDLAAKAILGLGINNFLIEAAGEVYALGSHPDGSSWRIGLELPVPGPTVVHSHIALSKQAIATSGGYSNRVEINGTTYSHVMSPRTRSPLISNVLSVSVIANSCLQADALATALMVMGIDAGLSYARKRKIAVMFMQRVPDGIEEIGSKEFKVFLSEHKN